VNGRDGVPLHPGGAIRVDEDVDFDAFRERRNGIANARRDNPSSMMNDVIITRALAVAMSSVAARAKASPPTIGGPTTRL